MRTMVDHTGEEYNGWILSRFVAEDHSPGKHAMYEARCKECGRIIKAAYSDLKQRRQCKCKMSEKPKDNQKCLFLAVTSDRYELPVAVADSVAELSILTGYGYRWIMWSMTPTGRKRYSQKRAKRGGLRFYRVPLDRGEYEAAV